MALTTRPRQTTSHKKRSGQHHRHSKHYLKAYWPYLPMMAIVGIGLAVNSLWSSQAVLGSSSDFSSTSLLSATNTQRATGHETALTLDSKLAAAAQAKANDMVQHDYWAHNSPSGRTPWSFIIAAGYQYQAAGENLAYGFANASDTTAGWMNSPEHRANILDANYQNVGFGVASSSNYQGKGPETVVVAEYGAPATALALSGGTAGATDPTNLSEPAARPIARIQLLTGSQASWSVLATSALAGAAFALFVVRYGLRLRRLAFEGEAFIAHHPMLDVVIVFVFTAGFVLTRTTGIIR